MRAFGMVLLLAAAATAAPLCSPWEKQVAVNDKPYACPAVMHVPKDIDGNSPYRKDDPTHSIIDPEADARNKAFTRPFYDVQRINVKAADAFRTTGSRAAAMCAIAQIYAMAADGAMTGHMASGQAFYVQGWIGGSSAVAWLKVRQMATPEENKTVAAWLHQVGSSVRSYYDPRASKSDGRNNHSYWAGFTLAAIGIAGDDRTDFDWAMKFYDRGVADIRTDGTLLLELQRAGRALHYHLYAVTPLVMLAEFGERNGIAMYAKSGGAIHRLAEVCTRGYADPAVFEKMTGVKQERYEEVQGSEFAWTVPYLHRFPAHPEIAALQGRMVKPAFDTIGGLPPD